MRPSSTDSVFPSLASMLESASKALGPLVEAIASAITKADHGIVTLLERSAHRRLKDLAAKTSDLIATRNIVVVDSLDEYIAHPRPENWERIVEKMERVLVSVTELLDTVRNERSDFVLMPAYQEFTSALQSRFTILGMLSSIPPPTSKQEIQELRAVNEKYRHLIHQLHTANRQLSAYIQEHKPD